MSPPPDSRAYREENDELRERVRQLEERLKPDQFTSYPDLGLSRGETAVLEVLMKTNGIVANERLAARLNRPPDSVRVSICRLRKKLRFIDPPVKIVTASGEGRYIPDEHKVRLAARAVIKGK